MQDLECREARIASLSTVTLKASTIPVAKVAELPQAERFFLWAIRAWASAHTDITEVWSRLDRGFARAYLTDALEPFDRVMSAVFAGLARWPDIRCVRCPYVGAEEARLLAALAALGRGDEMTARAALHDWIRPAAARQICRHGRVCMEIAALCHARLDDERRAFVTDPISSDSSSQPGSLSRSPASQHFSPSPRPAQPS